MRGTEGEMTWIDNASYWTILVACIIGIAGLCFIVSYLRRKYGIEERHDRNGSGIRL